MAVELVSVGMEDWRGRGAAEAAAAAAAEGADRGGGADGWDMSASLSKREENMKLALGSMHVSSWEVPEP